MTALVPLAGPLACSPAALTLRQFLDQRYIILRTITQSTYNDYAWTVNLFERWLGRRLGLDELTEDLLNRFLISCSDKAPATQKSHRGTLLVLWRSAAAEDLCRPPRADRVRKVKVPRKNPAAWTPDEMAKLIEGARNLKGSFRDTCVPRALFFEAVIRVTYETGLRRGDVFGITLSSINPDGTFSVTMSKTGDDHTCKVTPATLGMLRDISRLKRADKDTPLLVRGNLSTGFYHYWRLVRGYAGVKGSGSMGGAMQQLRRTAATQVEKERPGAAMGFLGHATPDMAYRHYVDRTQAFPVTTPPELATPVDMERLVREAEFNEAEKAAARDRHFAGKLVMALQQFPEGATRHQLRRTAGLDLGPFGRAEEMLLRAGAIEACEARVPGKHTPVMGWRLRSPEWQLPPMPQCDLLPDSPLASSVQHCGW